MKNKDKDTELMKVQYVYSKQKAIRLRKMGFPIIVRKPNHQFPEYDMYGFEATEEFLRAFENITGCKKKDGENGRE